MATPQERYQAGDEARAVLDGGAAETAAKVAPPEKTAAGTGTGFCIVVSDFVKFISYDIDPIGII